MPKRPRKPKVPISDNIWGKDDPGPKIDMLQRLYEEDGVFLFNNDKIAQLCKTLRWSIYDLAGWAGEFSPLRVRKYWETGKWPVPMKLHFIRLQKYADSKIFKSTIQPCSTGVAAVLIERENNNG